MGRFWVVALALGGCQVVFPLREEPFDPCPDNVGHDEDGDGIVDACDNCPGLSNVAQEDGLEADTADGIGDLCDPNPTKSADQIPLFVSFADDKESLLWSAQTTNNGWTFDGENLVFTAADATTSTLLALRQQPVAPFTVEFQIVVDADYVTDSNVGIRVDADHLATDKSKTGVTCGVQRDGGEDVSITNYDAGINLRGNSSPLPAAVVAGSHYRVRMTYEPDTVKCEVFPNLVEPGVISALPLVPRATGHELQFEAAATNARIEYLIIYKEI